MKLVLMHRIITSCPEGMEVDHKNENKLDNRRENLRVCTHRQNQSRQGLQRNNKSGFVGVSWDKSREKWASCLYVKGRAIHLGRFDDCIEAAKVYDREARNYLGEFAYSNFPDEVM